MLNSLSVLRDKLDTDAVNGPEGVLDWDATDWPTHESNVRRLRRRIFKATREQDWAQVRSLQKMMLRSWSNTLVSVRQVTQRNAGRRTAGIDGQVALTSKARAEMAAWLHHTLSARDTRERWLKAGVIEDGAFTPTEEGTPQGGVISPLLMNVALHGLEEAAGIRYQATGERAGRTERNSPVLVRYADDLVVCCHTQGQAQQVKAELAGWLAPRGLAFNEDKTRIVHLETEGFDFLGLNVRRYRNSKLLIKPSPTAVKRLRKPLATQVRPLRSSNAAAVIARRNPIIRTWAA